MPEMPDAGKHHGQSVFFTIINAVLITNRSAGLNKSGNAGIVSHFHAIVKWEEGIACHHSAVEIKIKLPCFFKGLAQSIYAACLSTALAHQLFVFYKCDGIAF